MNKLKPWYQHFIKVWSVIRENFLYLVCLDFIVGIQLLLGGGFLLLLYWGNVPWQIVGPISVAFLLLFDLSFTGVCKNLYALAAGRGQGKYPVFIVDYLWLGLPVLMTALLLHATPFLLLVAGISAALATQFAGWMYFVAAVTTIYLLWQWRFGLTIPVILDRKLSVWEAAQQSFVITGKHGGLSLSLVLADQIIMLIVSLIPFVGWLLALDWLFLSCFCYYLDEK